jgi:Protein of unknown function (DUF4230)
MQFRNKLGWLTAIGVVVIVAYFLNLEFFRLGIKTNQQPVIITNGRILSSVPKALLITQETTTQTFAAKTDKDQVDLGLFKFDIPGVVAGQTLTAYGDVVTTAGVDLSKMTKDDIQVGGSGNHITVTLHLPYPKVYYAEIKDNTLHQDTTRGVVTKILGVGHTDLESQAAQILKDQGQAQAIAAGIYSLAEQHATDEMSRLVTALYDVALPRTTVTVNVVYSEAPRATPTPAR